MMSSGRRRSTGESSARATGAVLPEGGDVKYTINKIATDKVTLDSRAWNAAVDTLPETWTTSAATAIAASGLTLSFDSDEQKAALQANDFTVYVVSGTDRIISRAIFYNNVFDIPPAQIIGSDVSLVATAQGEADGLEYTFKDTDEVIIGGEFLIKNLKMNKVTAIVREIGVQPVLSFGNSTGDAAMAEYTTSNNPYPSLAFMLCCDDTVRENGNVEKADKIVPQREVKEKNTTGFRIGGGITDESAPRKISD